ncbi:MarR family winged helix-turn-helix transcriptional regulator [Virgisporangium aliadipatigenens]|uniref:MarR family winged helix-turn-helix transcriptional regulator n=1 Tax=Virgisporangium aliadipatigenens TaxID=741659 RepID=UPI001EF34C8A|nr:MarR family winged helix-turn-helix transcriptional regulator [Virgisporangium aliadipatigenens]
MPGKPLDQPLEADEEAVWRALARVVLVLPRLMDADLLQRRNLTLSEYTVLMTLSEAPGRSMRMAELAARVPITLSGLTRLVERLARQDMVTRARSGADGRGQEAVLTDAGFERLREAWPAHLQSVRRIVLENLDGVDLPALTRALEAIADHEDDRRPIRRRAR